MWLKDNRVSIFDVSCLAFRLNLFFAFSLRIYWTVFLVNLLSIEVFKRTWALSVLFRDCRVRGK